MEVHISTRIEVDATSVQASRTWFSWKKMEHSWKLSFHILEPKLSTHPRVLPRELMFVPICFHVLAETFMPGHGVFFIGFGLHIFSKSVLVY